MNNYPAHLAELPHREAMRTPHKSRHTPARFTTRNPRRQSGGLA